MRYSPYHERRDGLKDQSVLCVWCVDDGVRRGHHIAPLGLGDLELLPVLNVVPSSLENSSTAVHEEGDPPQIIPTNMASESRSWGERLRCPKQLEMNSRQPKWMVLLRARPMSVGLLLLAMNESFGETIGTA
jgi:hypothetical protein